MNMLPFHDFYLTMLNKGIVLYCIVFVACVTTNKNHLRVWSIKLDDSYAIFDVPLDTTVSWSEADKEKLDHCW